jgi:cytochrome c6
MRNVSERTCWRSVETGWLLSVLLLICLPAFGQEASGKTLFLKNCVACHQVDGQGIPDAFPALAGNSFVQANANDVASLLLTGRSGMPNFSKRLNDQDIAAIVSYIRNAWGNQGAEMTPERVAALRAELHADMGDAAPQNNRH